MIIKPYRWLKTENISLVTWQTPNVDPFRIIKDTELWIVLKKKLKYQEWENIECHPILDITKPLKNEYFSKKFKLSC